MIRKDGDECHEWITGKQAGFNESSKLFQLEMCKKCGVLKRNPKYPETSCKGKVKVVLR